LEDFSPGDMSYTQAIVNCIKNNKCTFTVTKKTYEPQKWYNCFTCGLSDYDGICESCAAVCHKSHQLSAIRTSEGFFCDCGAGSYPCKCMSSDSFLLDMHSLLESNRHTECLIQFCEESGWLNQTNWSKNISYYTRVDPSTYIAPVTELEKRLEKLQEIQGRINQLIIQNTAQISASKTKESIENITKENSELKLKLTILLDKSLVEDQIRVNMSKENREMKRKLESSVDKSLVEDLLRENDEIKLKMEERLNCVVVWNDTKKSFYYLADISISVVLVQIP